MSEEPELHPHPAGAPYGRQDREMILAMSKAIVAIGADKNADEWSFELALEQFRYRQKFFPDTIEP